IIRNNTGFNTGLTLSTVVSGIHGLTLSGPSGLTLSPPAAGNSYTIVTQLNSGKVTLGTNNTPLGAATAPLDFYGGPLEVNVFLGDITLANPVVLNNATVTFSGLPHITFSGAVNLVGRNIFAVPSSTAITMTGKVTGPGNLTVQAGSPGGGTLTLSNAANDYAGGTVLVNQSIFLPTLVAGAATALGTGPLILSQGTIQASAPLPIANSLRLDNAARLDQPAKLTVGGTNAMTFSGPAIVNGINSLAAAADTTLSGNLIGPGALTKAGAATLVLSGNNSHTGATTVSEGTLLINGAQPGSPAGVTGGILGGAGTVGFVAGANPGVINPGSPGTAEGILTAAGA